MAVTGLWVEVGKVAFERNGWMMMELPNGDQGGVCWVRQSLAHAGWAALYVRVQVADKYMESFPGPHLQNEAWKVCIRD